jgi:hypothetical protein
MFENRKERPWKTQTPAATLARSLAPETMTAPIRVVRANPIRMIGRNARIRRRTSGPIRRQERAEIEACHKGKGHHLVAFSFVASVT